MYMSYEKFLGSILRTMGVGDGYNEFVSSGITVFLIVVLCWLADYLAKRVMLSLLAQFAKKSKTVLDDILVEKRFFHRLAQLAPAVVIYALIPVAFYRYPAYTHWVQIIAQSFMFFVGARVVDSFLNAVLVMYDLLPYAKQKPIKGYIQVFKIIVYFITILMILSVVFDKSLVYFFSGLGALAAVLMLVFKDSIQGLVAGIQLSSNNMLKPGDWITFSKYGADGNVVEISLHTVKVQNFDKTIVTIPTYSLIADSFQNWRGMEEAEGRRFKRSMTIDPRSVKGISEAFIKKLKDNIVTRDFVEKGELLETTLSRHSLFTCTNLGLFRMYVEYIIKNSECVNQQMSSIVKHGSLSENGLIIDIICFTRDKNGVAYERFQADLIEHLLAISSAFNLVIYTRPSGDDLTGNRD